MKGRPRKPAQLRVLEGRKGHRPIEFGPKFKSGFGSCPKYLDPESKKLWRQLSRELDEKGISARVYRIALEGLCIAYSRAVSADSILRERGLTIAITKTDDNGNPAVIYEQQRPEVSISNKAWQMMKHFCQEFGLTPASNGKVTVPKSKKESLRDQLMSNAK